MTIAVDFDGVIHDYMRGWHDGSIYGDWMPGTLPALGIMMTYEPVFVLTARDPDQVARWIEYKTDHCVTCTTAVPEPVGEGFKRGRFWSETGILLVTNVKLAARIYIDDRAYKFENWRDTLDYVLDTRERKS